MSWWSCGLPVVSWWCSGALGMVLLGLVIGSSDQKTTTKRPADHLTTRRPPRTNYASTPGRVGVRHTKNMFSPRVYWRCSGPRPKCFSTGGFRHTQCTPSRDGGNRKNNKPASFLGNIAGFRHFDARIKPMYCL